MITLEKKKNSKYIVYVGWSLILYTNNLNDIQNIKNNYNNFITYNKI